MTDVIEEDHAGGPPKPVVGVIVPAFRVEGFIEETLRSVQKQTFTEWECVVVDDGSPDNSAELVEKIAIADPRIRLVRQENRGLSGARNSGIAHLSDGVRYVAFLDGDDLWCEDALEHLVAALERDQSAVGSYGYAELADETGKAIEPGLHSGRQRDRRRLAGFISRPVAAELEPVRFDELVVANPVWPPAVALQRRDVVDEVGPFDVTLKQVEDLDFFIRMARHGHYRPVARQVAWYRTHSGQMTSRRAEFWWSHDRVRRTAWESRANSLEQRRTITRSWRLAQGRRIVRCSERVATALLRRRWKDVGRLAKGWLVLVVQSTRSAPPVARLEHVVWAGRDV